MSGRNDVRRSGQRPASSVIGGRDVLASGTVRLRSHSGQDAADVAIAIEDDACAQVRRGVPTGFSDVAIGDFAAVALWFPPHTEPDGDAVVAEVNRSIAPNQHGDFFALLEQMDSAHPKYPHWYLPWFGVDAAQQNKGLGGELMRQCLAFVDRDRLPAYLESPNPRNLPFYERHGFEVTGVSRAGACPPVYSMLRSAH